jgi:hypothetical protein
LRFIRNTEYDDFNNDYTTVPCTLKYDGSLQSSSSLNGTVTFTQNETYVTGSQNLESQMSDGCYMISANGTQWYYIDHFDEDDNTKLYLLTTFAETPPDPPTTAYKRQYSCDMDTFKGSFEKAGTDNVNIASGFRAKEPSISSGHIVNYSGLYVDPIMTEDTYGKITKSFGVFQSGKYDLNSFRGHTGMGMWDGVANAVLQVTQTYDTDDSNQGVSITVEQDAQLSSGSYPSGISCNLDYGVPAVSPVTIETDDSDLFRFIKGSTIVTADDTITNPPVSSDWIRPVSGTHWYVVISVVGLNINIYPEFEEDLPEPVTAVKMPAAYRMSGISGSNVLSDTGATSSLRGVTGSVGVTDDGNVQAGVGTRGGVNMSAAGAWMGIGACLATYSDITAGTIDSWYGLGIESPIIDDDATVNKEVAGVSVGRLMRLVDHDADIGENCAVYGFKQVGNECNYFKGYFDTDTIIGYYWDFVVLPDDYNVVDRANYSAQSVFENEYYFDNDLQEWFWYAEDVNIENLYGFKYETPVNHMDLTEKQAYITNSYALYLEASGLEDLTIEHSWGIYQAGEDDNFLGGALTIDKTSKVRIYCLSTLHPTLTSWAKVQLNNETYDILDEFDSQNYEIDIQKDGFYQINVNVNFTNTSCGEQLGARLMIHRGNNNIEQAYAKDDGYCNPRYPETDGDVSLTIPECVELKMYDSVYVQVQASGSVQWVDGENQTYMTIHKISQCCFHRFIGDRSKDLSYLYFL